MDQIDVEIILRGRLMSALLRAAEKRQRPVQEVFADIVEAVLADDLIDAVLDDQK